MSLNCEALKWISLVVFLLNASTTASCIRQSNVKEALYGCTWCTFLVFREIEREVAFKECATHLSVSTPFGASTPVRKCLATKAPTCRGLQSLAPHVDPLVVAASPTFAGLPLRSGDSMSKRGRCRRLQRKQQRKTNDEEVFRHLQLRAAWIAWA